MAGTDVVWNNTTLKIHSTGRVEDAGKIRNRCVLDENLIRIQLAVCPSFNMHYKMCCGRLGNYMP